MKLLSLFTFALLAFVKTSPPDIHSREVSSVENGRYLPKEDVRIFCNSRFIHCSEQISICENIEGISSKELYGRKTSDFVCDNKYSDDPHSGRGPPGIPTVRYIKMNIRFINCTPLTGNNKGPMIDLTDNISKYYIDGGKNCRSLLSS
ncbi:hypothetical protein BY996DRAFT_6951829 [Phakopsora pachyrhizi]|nr:hypothetical protein BY996DRAFT_6951829 [Phakopsora pachyrhizi]